mgnify:CR=1 FL=1
MAIPSGGGTEVLSSTYIHGLSNTTTTFRWDGTPATTGTGTYVVPDHHIITVLSIVFTEMSDNAETVTVSIFDGSQYIHLLNSQDIPAKGTFIWNDKFVVKAGHKVELTCSPANVDVYCTYIDQDWT